MMLKDNNFISAVVYLHNDGARAVEFCRCYGLEFDAVNDNTEELKRAYGTNPRKIGADYYIDDKAMPPDLFVS